jgi:hypothetical protein
MALQQAIVCATWAMATLASLRLRLSSAQTLCNWQTQQILLVLGAIPLSLEAAPEHLLDLTVTPTLPTDILNTARIQLLIFSASLTPVHIHAFLHHHHHRRSLAPSFSCNEVALAFSSLSSVRVTTVLPICDFQRVSQTDPGQQLPSASIRTAQSASTLKRPQSWI